MLKPSQSVPLDILVKDQTGQPISLKDTLGQYVVLYFYPKDNTPGCTTEACEFRDANAALKKLGVRVIGVSKDSPQSHRQFAEKHRLHFELWSDLDHQLLAAFGAWGEKKKFGKTYLGIIRSTFIISPKGKIIKTWEAVKPAGHSTAVLAFLQSVI